MTLPPAPRPLRAVPLLLAALLACGPANPVTIPELADTAEVDPELRERLDQAVAAARSGSPAAILELAKTYDANGSAELALETLELYPTASHDARTLYLLGRLCAAVGRPESALEAFERSRELEQGYGPTHWRRGDLLLELDRLDLAEEAYQRALTLESRALQPVLGLARVDLARGRPAAARDRLAPLVEAHPRARFLHGLQARALAQTGDLEGARRATQREARAQAAVVRDPWTAEVRTRAVGLLVTVERANEALARGEARAALDLLRPLNAARPGELSVLQMMGRALLEAGLPQEAAEHLDRALASHPDQFKLRLFRGQAALALRRAGPALAHLRRAVELNPAFGPAQASLGEACLQAGLAEEAATALAAAREAGSDGLRVVLLHARALRRTEAFPEARAVLEAAARRFRKAPEPWIERFELELAFGDPEAAAEALRELEDRGAAAGTVRGLRQRLERASGEREG